MSGLESLKKRLEELLVEALEAGELELENVTIEVDELIIRGLPVAPAPAPPPKAPEFRKAKFEVPKLPFMGKVAEVKIGATKADGGTRGVAYTIGGETTLPYYSFAGELPHRPLIALDVFDIPPPLAGPVKKAYEDVLNDPAEWAKKCIKDYGADLVSVHLISTDPLGMNAPVSSAVKTIENVLQAIDKPIIVGGSGNPTKDAQLFEAISEVTAGERLVMSSVTVDMDVERVAKTVAKYGHNLIALAFMDITQARDLCRRVLDGGLPKDHLIVDPTTGALGYGIEYTYSTAERIRLAALMGEEVLQVPISCAGTNAWAAREAWMRVDAWGPRELRGPLWEATTAMVAVSVGADLLMMMHPLAAKIVRKFIESFWSGAKAEWRYAEEWLSAP